MFVPTGWMSVRNWQAVTCLLVALSIGGSAVTDDDLPRREPPGTQFPRPRTPAATPPAKSRAAGDEAALPTIVTPAGGRRPIVVEGAATARPKPLEVGPSEPDVPIDPATPWHFETLVLRDETAYQGLLLAATGREAEFAQITRPPGKPMSAMVRVIPREQVQRFDRLPAEQRRVLVSRFHSFRRRATIEARKMETIALRPVEGDDGPRLVYEGQWFQLESTANDESTRRCVVRIEQMFGGFRQLLPPRVEPRGRLRIVLFGSMDEFRGRLRRWNLQLDNPAFYSPRQNMIVAGGDLARCGDQLARIRRDHEELLERFEALEDEFQRKLVADIQMMVASGFQREEIKVEAALRRTRWREQHARLRRDIQEANRRNDTTFTSVTDRMLRRLYHEGFHAYLENFVFPHREAHVDRWLNEGLAQIFENGRFDVGVLRLDAPGPDLLAKLQADLRSPEPLPLPQLLSAADATFLARHADDSTDRRYLYAWGVAYFLAFERGLLEGDALANYVARAAEPSSVRLARPGTEVDRFEALVGLPLDDFEAQWREFMLQLPAAS